MRNKIKLLLFSLLFLPLSALAQFGRGGIPPVTSPLDPVPFVRNATNTIELIIEILLAIVGLISVLFLIIGGFRYVTSGGNEETTESAKKTITNSIIGIIIVILAFVIVRVITNALISRNV